MDVQVNAFASFAIFPPIFFTPPFGFLSGFDFVGSVVSDSDPHRKA